MRLDLRGVQCPFVLARIVEALEETPEGGLEVECDDDRSVHQTVPAFCRARGYQYVIDDSLAAFYRIRIRPSSV